PLVWGTLISVPFVFTAMFIWAFVSSLTGPLRESGKPDPQDNLLLTLSFLPFFISLGSVVFLYTRRKNVKKTINIIELACEILNANRRMVNVSLIILGAYILFTIIWLIFFSRVFLYGHMVQTSSSAWMFYQNSYLLIFFVFMYLWTSAVLYNIQRYDKMRFIVMHLLNLPVDYLPYAPAPLHLRRELDRDASQDTCNLALRRATTSSLGSICLGGLILSTVRFLHLINEFTKKNIRRSSVFYCITTCFACLDGIISVLDKYTLICVGISGESYFSSAVFTAKLFRRNLVFGLVNDTITNIILRIGAIMISLFCGFATFIYATHSLQSSYGYVVGILASIIPYYIAQFFVCIMMNIVDATFLCYAIDLDTNKIHCTKAHEAFSNFQIQ
ncbi:8246_t:CDS:2, partial [Gigaspora rosea]